MKFSDIRNRATQVSTKAKKSVFDFPEGIEKFEPTKAKHRLSILPFKVDGDRTAFDNTNPYAREGDWHWESTFEMIAIPMEGGKTKTVYISPDKLDKEDDRRTDENPVETKLRKLQTSNGLEWSAISPFFGKKKMAFYVYDHDEKKVFVLISPFIGAGSAISSFAKKLIGQLNSTDDDDFVENFCNPNTGYVFNVLFEKPTKGHFSKFWMFQDFTARQRETPIPKEAWRGLPPLYTLFNVPTLEKLQDETKGITLSSLIAGGEDENELDAALDDERPAKRKQRFDEDEDEDEPVRPKKRPVVDDEDEDEPVRPKKRPVVDDEDEDEPVRPKKRPVVDDEDEDEPVRPKKTLKKSRFDDED